MRFGFGNFHNEGEAAFILETHYNGKIELWSTRWSPTEVLRPALTRRVLDSTRTGPPDARVARRNNNRHGRTYAIYVIEAN